MELPLDTATATANPGHPRYALRFQSLFHQGRAMLFPCDEQGHVDLDALSERARQNYLYARAVIGFEYATPSVTRDYSAELH